MYYGMSAVLNDQAAGGVPNMIGFLATDVDYATMEATSVAGVRVDFTIDSGSATLPQPWCVTDDSGTCTIPVTSSVAGTVLVRGFVNDEEVTGVPDVGTYASPVLLTFTEPVIAPPVSSTSSVPTSTTPVNPTSTETTATSAPSSPTSAPATSSPAPSSPASTTSSPVLSTPASTESSQASTPATDTSTPVPPATHGVYYGISAVLDGQAAGAVPNMVGFAAMDADYTTMQTTPVSGVRVDFTIDSGSATMPQSWCVTDGTGSCTVPVTSSIAGTVVVRGFVNGEEVTGIPQVGTYASPITLTFAAPVVVPPVDSTSAAPSTSTPAVTPSSPAANASSSEVSLTGVSVAVDGQPAGGTPNTVQFIAMDADYVTMTTTPVSGVQADFVIESGSATLSKSSCVTDETGTCTISVTSDVAGSVVVSASTNGQPVVGVPQLSVGASPVTLTFVPATSVPSTSNQPSSPTTSQGNVNVPTHGVVYAVTAALDGQSAGGTPNMLGFAATDADYLTGATTPIADVRVDFSVESGTGVLPQTWCVTDETGTCTVPVLSTAAGAVVVKAVVDGQEVTGIPQVGTYASPVTFTFAAPSGPDIVVNTSSLAGGDAVIVTGDGWVPGESVHLIIHSDSIDLGTVTANSDGTIPDVTFYVPSDFEAGAHTIMAVGSLSGSVESTFVIPQGSVPQSGTTVPTGGTAAVMPNLIWLVIAAAGIGAGALLAKKNRQKAKI